MWQKNYHRLSIANNGSPADAQAACCALMCLFASAKLENSFERHSEDLDDRHNNTTFHRQEYLQ